MYSHCPDDATFMCCVIAVTDTTLLFIHFSVQQLPMVLRVSACFYGHDLALRLARQRHHAMAMCMSDAVAQAPLACLFYF